MGSVPEQVLEILGKGDQSSKTASLQALASDLCQSGDEASLVQFVDQILDESLALGISRPVLAHFSMEIRHCPDPRVVKTLIRHTMSKIEPRLASFEEIDATLRRQLSEILEGGDDFTAAAVALAGIHLDAASRFLNDEERVEINVKIAELYLQEDDIGNAEKFINKASKVIHFAEDWVIKMRYEVSHARIMDSKKNFLPAARKFYQLSRSHTDKIEPEDIASLLQSAVICAILAPAGPQRSRLLGLMSHDDRMAAVPHFHVVDKMYRERLVTKRDVMTLEDSLQDHQKATYADGTTVLEKAIVQHNMLAVSKLYSNITFAQLSSLLDLSEGDVEKVAAKMITEGRLSGTIDQVKSLLLFDTDVAKSTLQTWDQQIAIVCDSANSVSELLLRSHPELADGPDMDVA